jgi:ribosomal protein S27AE
VRHAVTLVFALCISIIGGTAFVYMIHAHSSAWRWMYTSAAMLFLTGVMVAYDELFVPSITCPKCGRTSYHPKDIAEHYCGVCGYYDGVGSK